MVKLPKFSVVFKIAALTAATLPVLFIITSCNRSQKQSAFQTQLTPIKNSTLLSAQVVLLDKTQDARTAGYPEFLQISKLLVDSRLQGYMVDTDVNGRSGSFRIRTMLDSDYNVTSAQVLNYPWVMGAGVCSKEFTDQFTGKSTRDPFRIGDDIDAVTGSTISSKAMARGVRNSITLTRSLVNTLSQ